MSEDLSRQTRSQKRALERESLSVDVDSKRLKVETVDQDVRTVLASKSETSSLLSGGEVKATIKVEVQTGDEPMDMSTKKTEMKGERSPLSPDDVIVLSDNEPSSPHMNGGNHIKELDTQLLMRSSSHERERVIKQLTEELRLEETKLILLKKLRHAQIQKDSKIQKPIGSVPSPPVRTSASSKTAQPVISGRGSETATLPPLVRGGQVSKHGGSQIIMPPLVRGAQPISVTTQQIASLRPQQQISGSAAPLLLAHRASVPNVQGHKIIQPGLIHVTNAPNGSLLVSISQTTAANLKPASAPSQSSTSNVTDTPASRQAAMKLALRKQLEKTLLEIPSPKPPAGEFNFLPSAANNEFIYLLGLEEVVQNLLDSMGRGKQGLYAGLGATSEEPFCCSQCKTDFTCRWRKGKGGVFICEQCMSTNQKKVVKTEHTSRLKSAFVKALQQEQEILSKTPMSSSSSSSSPAHGMKVDQSKARSSPSVQQTHSRPSQSVNRHLVSIKQNPVQLARSVQPSVTAIRGVPHSSSASSQLRNAVAAAALVNRPGKHAVHQGSKVSSSDSKRKSDPTTSSWRKQISVTPGVTMAYVNPSLSVHKSSSSSSSSSSVERQREYLLDMIPSRSVSQTANTWK
nr:transcriptional repressor p66-alpha-like isoform X2 [Misgurnus anguillicaudatus]